VVSIRRLRSRFATIDVVKMNIGVDVAVEDLLPGLCKEDLQLVRILAQQAGKASLEAGRGVLQEVGDLERANGLESLVLGPAIRGDLEDAFMHVFEPSRFQLLLPLCGRQTIDAQRAGDLEVDPGHLFVARVGRTGAVVTSHFRHGDGELQVPSRHEMLVGLGHEGWPVPNGEDQFAGVDQIISGCPEYQDSETTLRYCNRRTCTKRE